MSAARHSPPDSYKVVLLGDASVGKTSLFSRWADDLFDPAQRPTIGAGFRAIPLELDGTVHNIHIWDTAGQECYRSTCPFYIRNARAAMLVYDITLRVSFENLNDWLKIVRDVGEIPIVVVGNKADLAVRRAVDQETAFEWAQQQNAKFYETSALTDILVKEAFVDLALLAIDNRDCTTASQRPVGIDDRDSARNKNCCALLL
jgi:small GTP-binding protein